MTGSLAGLKAQRAPLRLSSFRQSKDYARPRGPQSSAIATLPKAQATREISEWRC